MTKQDCLDVLRCIATTKGYGRITKTFLKEIAPLLDVDINFIEKDEFLINFRKKFANEAPVITSNRELKIHDITLSTDLELTEHEAKLYSYIYQVDVPSNIPIVEKTNELLFYGLEDKIAELLRGSKIARIRASRKSWSYKYDDYPDSMHGIIENERWLCDNLGNPNFFEHTATYRNRTIKITNPIRLNEILKGYNTIIIRKAPVTPLDIQIAIYNILGYSVICVTDVPLEIRNLLSVVEPVKESDNMITVSDKIVYKGNSPYLPSLNENVYDNHELCAQWRDVETYMKQNHKQLTDLIHDYENVSEDGFFSVHHKILFCLCKEGRIKKPCIPKISKFSRKVHLFKSLLRSPIDKSITSTINYYASLAISSTPKMDAVSTAIYLYATTLLKYTEENALKLARYDTSHSLVQKLSKEYNSTF